MKSHKGASTRLTSSPNYIWRSLQKGRTQCVDFLTWISFNGKSSLLDLVITNLPAHVSWSSSTLFGSSDHVLVRVNMSPAILRELRHRHQVGQFTQVDWQGLQTAISLQDWSSILAAPDINSKPAFAYAWEFWEFVHINLLSLMHRFIPSHLQLSYPTSHQWYSESCWKAVAMTQLAFIFWKGNPNKGDLSLFHKACNMRESTLRRARKQHLSNNLKIELSNLSSSSKT